MNEKKIQTLRNRMFKLLTTKSYSANRNHVNSIERQLRYLESGFSRSSSGVENK